MLDITILKRSNIYQRKLAVVTGEVKCGYHYSAADYFKDQHREGRGNAFKPLLKKAEDAYKAAEPSFIANETLQKSLIHYEKNNFIVFLNQLFEKYQVAYLINEFRIGTSKYWPGATVFGKLMTGKGFIQGKSCFTTHKPGKE